MFNALKAPESPWQWDRDSTTAHALEYGRSGSSTIFVHWFVHQKCESAMRPRFTTLRRTPECGGSAAQGRCLVMFLLALGCALEPASSASAQSFSPEHYQSMRWRMIGPHRAGRTKAAAGIPDQPNVFYIGVVNGGVWKTTDYGRTWFPIFDEQPTGSVGAIALAPSNPDIIYVGSGEGLQRPELSTGDGI